MNIRKLLIASVVTLSTGIAMAQTAGDVSNKAPTLTRAEVLADLVIYRESGLDAIERAEGADGEPVAYRAARQRYEALRHSQRYAQLVRSYEAKTGEHVAAAVTSTESTDNKGQPSLPY